MAEEIIINVAMDRFKIHEYRRAFLCTGTKPGEFIDISDIDKLESSPLANRLLSTSQLGRKGMRKEIAARGMMRALLAEAGKIDESYLGPEWILASNEILSDNLERETAEGMTRILRERIGLKELNG